MSSHRLAGLAALIAAGVIVTAVASSRWFEGEAGGRVHAVGPLGIEECARRQCAAAWWGDLAAQPGPWAALGVSVAAAGAVAAAVAAVGGALVFAGRRPPWSPRLPLTTALAFVTLTLAFSFTRPGRGLPPTQPARGLGLALAGGGLAVAAALALACVTRAGVSPDAPRSHPHAHPHSGAPG